MSESPIQCYLHSLLQCPAAKLSAFVEEGVPETVQKWLAQSVERQQDFTLLMETAQKEPFITEFGEIGHVLDDFGADDDYRWKELMACVVAVGNALDTEDSEFAHLGMAIIRLLLEAGDSPNNDYAIALDSGPLHYACRRGYLQLAELLLRYGADPNMEDADMWTPLHFAAHNNQADCAELLIKHGALIDAPDCAGWTPLRWAISGNNKDVVALLKKRGVHITEFSEKDWDRYMKTHKISHN